MSKRSDQLFEYLVQIAGNILEATQHFEQGIRDLSEPETLASEFQGFEKKGDELVEQLDALLNNTYITPLEREDFLELSVKMDDIVDCLEACTVRFDLYSVRQSTPQMLDFAADIRRCAEEIAQAMALLQTRDIAAIRPHVRRVNELEKGCDQRLRQSLRELFTEPTDPLYVIKFKEIYELLEATTDRCEAVGEVLGSVIVKNS